MKFLKVILIVVLVLAGLLLVIPIFLPPTTTVSVEEEIALMPVQVFQNAAVFDARDQWDPWLKMEPDAKVTITPEEGYIGSTYEWEGQKIGSGKMQVDSVVFGEYIASSIWFGGSKEASLVEWMLDKTETGTKVSWEFTSEGTYPFGRWMMLFMKGSFQSSFENGLADYKIYLEGNPPSAYWLSEIVIDKLAETDALVVSVKGTMEEIGLAMMENYPMLYQEIGKQGLEVKSQPFAYYLDHDMETGVSNVLIGVPVNGKAKKVGKAFPKLFPEMNAVVALHHGSYEYFTKSYETLMKYVQENEIEVRGEAFEIYLKSFAETKDQNQSETLIGFPIKEN